MVSVPRPSMPPLAEAVIERAGRLTREEIVRLDLAERAHDEALRAAWDLLRDRYAGTSWSQVRFDARARAWAAVGDSLVALGLPPVPDDGYWRVIATVGAGAARAARYAACVLVAPAILDEDVAAMLLGPWQSVIGPIGD